MSHYSRKTRLYNDYYGRSNKTKVSIHWSQKADAYSIFFHKNGKWFPSKKHFEAIQHVFLPFINNLPYGEKEKTVRIDIINNEEVQEWTYYIAEKHLENFRKLVELMPEDFEIDFIEKPDETNQFASKIIPTETWLEKFKEITNENISGLDYGNSKRIYRRFCMLLHPDRQMDNEEARERNTKLMSELNEVWNNLEIQHFKTRVVNQLQEEGAIM